jgi:flagellar basal body-associated protein FliL
MNKGLKITLIVVGSLALAGGITYAIVMSVRKKKEQKAEQEKELKETQQLEEINAGLESQQTTQQSNKVIPLRN